MNTNDIAALEDWDESELETLVARFVRSFHRMPSQADLVRFRRTRTSLHLRIPAQTRRSIARMIVAV
jgi:hypothetical protein